MLTNMSWFKEFIEREKMFFGKTSSFPKELDPAQDHFFSKLQELEENAKTLFDLMQNLNEDYMSKFGIASNKEGMLIVIIKEIYELIIASSSDFEFFDKNSFFKLCPNFFSIENENKNNAGNYSSLFYLHMLDVCLFTTLCSFINTTKRKSGLYSHRAIDKYYVGRKDTIEGAVKFKHDLTETEKANIRKKNQRLFEKKSVHIERHESSPIPLDSGYEFALLYEFRFYDYLKREYIDRILVDENLAEVFKRIGNLYNNIEKAFAQPYNKYSKEDLNKAIKSCSSKIKKIKYVDFLELNKYILSKICENKEYYGINLYRFEKSLRLYGTINEVNLFSMCQV